MKSPFYLVKRQEINPFKLWRLVTFEPLEIYQSYIPFWKAQECGNNAWEAQGRGCMFMLRQTSVKMAVLLHKQASDRFHLLLTVCILRLRYLTCWCCDVGMPTTTACCCPAVVDCCCCCCTIATRAVAAADCWAAVAAAWAAIGRKNKNLD